MASELNLDAVRARYVEATRYLSSHAYAKASADDVPVLVAEIERLRAELDSIRLLANLPPRHPAQDMPAPRGYQCAAGCRHSIHCHREGGCDVMGCDCPAPFGRIVQSDVPDDASSITGGES